MVETWQLPLLFFVQHLVEADQQYWETSRELSLHSEGNNHLHNKHDDMPAITLKSAASANNSSKPTQYVIHGFLN